VIVSIATQLGPRLREASRCFPSSTPMRGLRSRSTRKDRLTVTQRATPALNEG
jgi:hypothetical protein